MSYYGTNDFSYNSDFNLRIRDIKKGNLDFGWLDRAREEVKVRRADPRRGLTLEDCEVGEYSIENTAEVVRENRGVAPRGALLADGTEQPDLGPSLNKKTDVWAYRVQSYWEEAMSRQWNATTDVPWGDMDKYEIPEDSEVAGLLDQRPSADKALSGWN